MEVDSIGDSNQCKGGEDQVSTSAQKSAPNLAPTHPPRVPDQLVEIPQQGSFRKDQNSYSELNNEAVEEVPPVFVSNNVEPTPSGSERLDLDNSSVQSTEHVVPEASPLTTRADSERYATNCSPFDCNEDIMDCNNSAVSSDVSAEPSDDEEIYPPVDVTNTGSTQQSHLLFQVSTGVLTERLPREEQQLLSAAIGNHSMHGGCSRGYVTFPENKIVDPLVEEMECSQPLYHYPPCMCCHNGHIDTIVYPCSDVCLCRRCAELLKTNDGQCPKCNGHIEGIGPANLPYPY